MPRNLCDLEGLISVLLKLMPGHLSAWYSNFFSFVPCLLFSSLVYGYCLALTFFYSLMNPISANLLIAKLQLWESAHSNTLLHCSIISLSFNMALSILSTIAEYAVLSTNTTLSLLLCVSGMLSRSAL